VSLLEQLAVELHRHYRAADKAMHGANKHDHGWDRCPRKTYFLKRAALIVRRSNVRDADTLGEVEQALAANILKRRLAFGETGK
jgi:hypothetical protein